MRFEHLLQNFAEEFGGGGSGDLLVLSLLKDRKERMARIDALMYVICDDLPQDPGRSG
jgi:hypothetical protein